MQQNIVFLRRNKRILKKNKKYLVLIQIFLHKVLPKLINCYKPYKDEVWSEESFTANGYVVEDMINHNKYRK